MPETYVYSDIVDAPISLASRRIETASIPSSSAIRTAASTICRRREVSEVSVGLRRLPWGVYRNCTLYASGYTAVQCTLVPAIPFKSTA